MSASEIEPCRIWEELAKTGILGKYPASQCPFEACDGKSCQLDKHLSKTSRLGRIAHGLIAHLIREAAHGPSQPQIPPLN